MIGQTVNRFTIVAKLGEGGMGSVWRAEDPLLGRAVAIKFLPETLANHEDSRRRFLREARAASALDHPGIATIYDAGEADGRHYIAMQLVDGETVSERVREGSAAHAGTADSVAITDTAASPAQTTLPPLAEAVRIATRVAEALGYAHERGVVHRDITGRNVMIARDGRVVVVDFGLALPEGHTKITTTGSTMGTVGYLAPEVIQGAPADPRSDLYSLGVVLYELITGRLPFEAERTEAVLYMAVNEAPEPPSAWRPGTPRELDDIVLRAIEKEPEDRYQRASDLIGDLCAIDDLAASDRAGAVTETVTLPVRPTPPRRTPERTPRTPRERAPMPAPTAPTIVFPPRTPLAKALALLRQRWLLVLTLAVAAGVALAIWPHARQRGLHRFSSVAVLPLHNASADPDATNYLANGITESLIAKLTQVSDLRVTPWITSSRYAESEQPLEEIAAELNVDALIVGTFNHLGDNIQGTVSLVDAKTGFQYWADEFEEPVADLFAVQRKIALGAATNLKGKLSGSEQREIARPAAQSVAAYEFYLKGAAELQGGTEETVNNALAYFQKAIEIDSTLAEAYVGIGAVHSDRYWYGWEGSQQTLRNAQANYEHALELNPNLIAARRGLMRIGNEIHYRQVLEQGRIIAESGRDDVEALLARGEAYTLGNLQRKAIPLFQRVIALDPANAAAYWFLPIALTWESRYEEAVEWGAKYIEKFGDDGEVYIWMSASSHYLGRLEDAEGYYHKAEAAYGDAADDRGVSGYSSFYIDLGRPEVFRHNLQRRLEVLNARLAAFPDNWRLRAERGHVFAYLGDLEKARSDWDMVSPDLLDPIPLILQYATAGDTTAARELLEKTPMDRFITPATSDLPPWRRKAIEGAPVFNDLMQRTEEAYARAYELY